jgi:hypothetical protein
MTSMIGTGSRIMLWLFVINLGIALGAGLYESRIVTPEWLSSSESVLRWNAEAARRDNTGMRFWIFVSTVPLTFVTLANAIIAWRTEGAVRNWWLGAAAVALMERTVTFSYFIPVMAALMQTPDPLTSVKVAATWMTLNHGRHALLLTAWLAALQAFSMAHNTRREGRVR